METQTPIHYGLCQLLEDDEWLRLAIMMFRGSLKTSILSGAVIQQIIKNPAIQIGVGSETQDRAQERFLAIKMILETNQSLAYFYPDVFYKNPRQESYRWNEEEMYVKLPEETTGGFRKATITSFGLYPLPVGSHYDFAWLDDVEHEENTTTDENVKKLLSRVHAFMPTLNAGAKVVLTGTYYHTQGPNYEFTKKWPSYRVPILDKHGNPTFPTLKPLAECQRIQHEDVDDWGWQTQFMLNVLSRNSEFAFPFRNKMLQVARAV